MDLGVTILCNASIKLGIFTSMSEKITLEYDQHAYQEHQNGDFIDNVHRPNVKITGSVRVFLSEKITPYFTQLKKLFPATLFLFVAHIKIFLSIQDQSNYHLP